MRTVHQPLQPVWLRRQSVRMCFGTSHRAPLGHTAHRLLLLPPAPSPRLAGTEISCFHDRAPRFCGESFAALQPQAAGDHGPAPPMPSRHYRQGTGSPLDAHAAVSWLLRRAIVDRDRDAALSRNVPHIEVPASRWRGQTHASLSQARRWSVTPATGATPTGPKCSPGRRSGSFLSGPWRSRRTV